jgi:hypothetical protein
MKGYITMVWVLNVMELLSCITGFIYFRKLKATSWRLLPFYLLAIICFEMVGRYLANSPGLIRYNPILFNYISYPMQFLFFFYLFYIHSYFIKKEQLVIAGVVIYVISIIADIFIFSKRVYFFHSFSYCTGALVYLIFQKT